MQANPSRENGALAPARCDSCGAEATHIYGRQPVYAVCEFCARRDSNHTRGEAWAATGILARVLGTLRGAGCSDDDIRRIVDIVLEDGCDNTDNASADWQLGGFEDDHRFIPLKAEAS